MEKGVTGLLPGKILAVGDDPKALQIIQAALQEAGFDVLTAASGAEALGVVRDAAPDLVLLDLKMPGMSGREMLQEIKSQQE
ncbi:MAG: response regulator transcription factor, partial [candidate division NC10 bacterium]|nr:response regulator transcription factor [candidate division NC10 bacterium]